MIYGINILAVLAAVISSWLLGGLWYSRFVFGSIYSNSTEKMNTERRHPAKVLLIAFILWTITAAAFSYCIGPYAPLGFSLIIGLFTGAFFVSTSFGVNYVYTGKNYKIFLIDGGYHILQFALYGLIFGLCNQYMASTSVALQALR